MEQDDEVKKIMDDELDKIMLLYVLVFVGIVFAALSLLDFDTLLEYNGVVGGSRSGSGNKTERSHINVTYWREI